MSRAIVYETFGGPAVLRLRYVPEPSAGRGEVRVRVTSVGLNPMDWRISSLPDVAAKFGITAPAGFGSDFAGVIDQVDDRATGFSIGDRVYGCALGKAAADFVVLEVPAPAPNTLFRTPEGIVDQVASTLTIAGSTAAAALATIGVRSGDTVLIGGAAGGVGLFVVQLARLAGAAVIGTCSAGTCDFLRHLGAEPVTYGLGLEKRVRGAAPHGVTAAIDLFGTETAEAALALGVPPERICTIAAGPRPRGGVRATGAVHSPPDALRRITDALLAGTMTVPIAATFPIERIRDAVMMQAERHVHGKIVITL